MPQQKEPKDVPKFSPFKWDDTFYQVMGSGPSICYLHFHISGRDARLVLQRYPASTDNPWRTVDVYFYNTETQKFERTPKSNFQLNMPVALKFSHDLNSTLPSVDYLYTMRNGCCCHYTRDTHERAWSLIPDIDVCNAKSHYVYTGADFVGKLRTSARRNHITGQRKAGTRK